MQHGGGRGGHRAWLEKLVAQVAAAGMTVGMLRVDGSLDVYHPDGTIEHRDPPLLGLQPPLDLPTVLDWDSEFNEEER